MNIIFEMQQWLQEQRELISSQQKQWFDMAVVGHVNEEEALRNIGELIIQRRFLDKVQIKVCEIETAVINEAEEEAWSHTEDEEDGCDLDLFHDEEEMVMLFPDDEEEGE